MTQTISAFAAMIVGRGTRSRFRLLAFIFLLATASAASGADNERVVTFVQLTDAHIFDGGKWRNGKANRVELAGTLAALEEAAKRVTKEDETRKFDFVVVTGDLGLEMVTPFYEKHSAKFVADWLRQLPVKTILFVPGNNDLLDEDARDLPRHESFIATLRDALKDEKTVIDLTTQGSVDIKGVRFIGLDSATFKNSHCSDVDKPANRNDAEERCKKNHDRQLDEMQRVAGELANWNGSHSVLFTHIPDLYDPKDYSDYMKAVANKETPKGLRSSWHLQTRAKDIWNKEISQSPSLKAIFAGHFHSAKRDDYLKPAHLRYTAFDSFIVSPPLSYKFQTELPKTARGFLIGSIDATNGSITPELQFFEP